MAKVNQQTMKTQYDGQYDTFCRKNHDYGNSFEESLDQFGIVASIVRMSDKMKRLESLTDESKTQQVGSESLLDTLEDLSNYAAMTACWLKGVREEDGETSCGPDMIDVIKYNVQDAKNVMSSSAEMEKEFNKRIPSKVENIDPRNYVLNMLSNIFRVVQMKIEKDEMLVPMDVSDEAGLIAKAIVESQTVEEGGAVINNYMCTRKDIPYELKDWIYGIIMRYVYYLKKEREEIDNFTEKLSDLDYEVVSLLKQVKKFHHKIEEFKMTEADHKELEEIINRLRVIINDAPISKEGVVSLIKKHVRLNPDVLIHQLFNRPEDTVKHLLKDLYATVFVFRDNRVPIGAQLDCLDRKKEVCNQLAKIVLKGLVDFATITIMVNTSTELHVDEKKDILESIVAAAYEIDSENFPGVDNKSEFLNKKFHIPDEVLEDLKEPEEEPERKRTVFFLGMIFPFRL